MTEIVDVDVRPERLYTLLSNFIQGQKDMKIKKHSRPSYMEVEVGISRWYLPPFRRGPCDMMINILHKNNGSQLNLSFVFSRFNFALMVYAPVALLATYFGFQLYQEPWYIAVAWIAGELLPILIIWANMIPGYKRKTESRYIDRISEFLGKIQPET